MAEFEVTVKVLSPIHLSSGKADVNVDAEIIHDALGFPYFPAKRFKGLMYESAVEICEMFKLAGIDAGNLAEPENIFHRYSDDTGNVSDVQIIVPNFYILPLEKYQQFCTEWKYLQHHYKDIFKPTDVLKAHTSIRYQTKLENGIAFKGSLHNMRVLNAGVEFTGKITVLNGDDKVKNLLALAIKNMSAAGMKRNRGFGRISCTANFDNGLNADDIVEKIFAKEA